LKNRQSWIGFICCFILFIAVCLFLILKVRAELPGSAHPELGLLLFIIPGVAGCLVSRRRHIILPLMGAVVAAPVCYVLAHLLLAPARPFWQLVAWMFSAVFWCGIGGLGCHFLRNLCHAQAGSRK